MRRIGIMLTMFLALSATGAGAEGEAKTVPTGRPSAKGDPPPEFEMRTYVLALLFRGPTPEPDPEKSKEIFRGHLANIARLHEEGKIILAGPMLDKTDLRGIFLFDLDSVEEAQKLCDTDPAIQAGSLRVELHPWYSAKGIGISRQAP